MIIGLLALGLTAGVLAGMFGIGGGIVIVPALLFFFKMAEKDAVGTSLAALLPAPGIFAVISYYRAGHVNIKYSALIALGLMVGAVFGAKIMLGLPPGAARRLYGGFLAVIAVKMLFYGK